MIVVSTSICSCFLSHWWTGTISMHRLAISHRSHVKSNYSSKDITVSNILYPQCPSSTVCSSVGFTGAISNTNCSCKISLKVRCALLLSRPVNSITMRLLRRWVSWTISSMFSVMAFELMCKVSYRMNCQQQRISLNNWKTWLFSSYLYPRMHAVTDTLMALERFKFITIWKYKYMEKWM